MLANLAGLFHSFDCYVFNLDRFGISTRINFQTTLLFGNIEQSPLDQIRMRLNTNALIRSVGVVDFEVCDDLF